MTQSLVRLLSFFALVSFSVCKSPSALSLKSNSASYAATVHITHANGNGGDKSKRKLCPRFTSYGCTTQPSRNIWYLSFLNAFGYCIQEQTATVFVQYLAEGNYFYDVKIGKLVYQ